MQSSGTVERGHPHATVRSSQCSSAERLLEQVESPSPRTTVLLTSGRRIELEAADATDHIVVRARDGRVVLDIEVSDRGPRLCFEAAELELRSARSVAIAAEKVTIDATRSLSLSSGGDLAQTVAGHHHTRVSGEERLEASSVEIQANESGVGLRAMQRIALDGAHVGLNDDPCPRPFAWSALSREGEDDG